MTDSEGFLNKLNKIIGKEYWEKSAILKVFRKRLIKIKEKVEDSFKDNKVQQATDIQSVASMEGRKIVYVVLFQVNGSNLNAWEKAMMVLSACSFGRPIYASEGEARQFVKSKGENRNNAYVAISVDEKNILTVPDERIPRDRLGQKIISLQVNSLVLTNIIEFVHANSDRYVYFDGNLKKKQ